MRLGMGITQKNMAGMPLTSAELMQRARMIEDVGFDGIWVGDGFPSFARCDVLAWLLVAAAATERVELGTSILIIPMQHPISMAHRLITMQALCPDRFSIAVGTGSEWEGHELMGSDWDTRFARLYEYVETIKELCAGTPTNQLTHVTPPSPRLEGRIRQQQPPREGPFGKHWGSLVGGPHFILGAYHSELSLKRAAKDFEGWIGSPGRTNYNTLRDAINYYRDQGGKRAMVSSCHIDLNARRKINDDDSYYLQCSREEAIERLGRLQELGFDDIYLVASNTAEPRPLYEQDYTRDQLEEWRSLLPRDDKKPYVD